MHAASLAPAACIFLLQAVIVALPAQATGSTPTTPPRTDAPAAQPLWSATYCTQPQSSVEIAYHGPLRPYRGVICYGFAGYSETCFNPQSDWLTPASRFKLPGPGQVPADVLAGYTLLLRVHDEPLHAIAMQPGRCLDAAVR